MFTPTCTKNFQLREMKRRTFERFFKASSIVARSDISR